MTDPEDESNSISTVYDPTVKTNQGFPLQDTILSFSFRPDIYHVQHHLSLIQYSHKCLESQF